MADDKLKVLFIVGWGRSGTTVLDNILGNLDGFVSTGELCYFWDRGILEGRLCGCGSQVWECELWSAVLKKGFDGPDAVDAEEVMSWRLEALRIRHTTRILRSASRNWPGSRALANYVAVAERLYTTTAELTGGRVIVDSSKRPSDAAALMLMDGITPFYVHMIRDPRAVAYSWTRPKRQKDLGGPALIQPHGPIESSQRWIEWNVAGEAVMKRRGEGGSMRVRYEDFVENPQQTVREIARMVGETPAELGFVDDRTVRLTANHTVSGNPSRFDSGLIELRRDEEWITHQRLRDSVLATLFALPMLRRYGYPVRSGRSPGSKVQWFSRSRS